MDDLKSLVKDLHNISGLNISIFDIDEKLVTSYPEINSPFCGLIKERKEGQARCQQCDHDAFERVRKTGKLEIYRCYFNLYEAVVPVYTYGIHTGYLMMGQTLTTSDFDKEAVFRNALPYIGDEAALRDAIDKIPFHSREQIISIAKIISICGEYLTLTNRLHAKKTKLAEEVKRYLIINYQNEISINDLCDYFYCSKATLSTAFKNEFGISVHQFLLDYRFSKACEMLKDKKLSVQEVSSLAGFKDPNYFSKAFKKQFKISPGDYRNSEQ